MNWLSWSCRSEVSGGDADLVVALGVPDGLSEALDGLESGSSPCRAGPAPRHSPVQWSMTTKTGGPQASCLPGVIDPVAAGVPARSREVLNS